MFNGVQIRQTMAVTYFSHDRQRCSICQYIHLGRNRCATYTSDLARGAENTGLANHGQNIVIVGLDKRQDRAKSRRVRRTIGRSCRLMHCRPIWPLFSSASSLVCECNGLLANINSVLLLLLRRCGVKLWPSS